MKKAIDCIAICDAHLCDSPKLKDLILLEAIWFDRVTQMYYIDVNNPLATLLLIRFPNIRQEPLTISVTIN